jgi:hypothetical protein
MVGRALVVAVALLAVFAGPALAGEVFINGVRVAPAQLAGTELRNVVVRMNANGDVLIDAPHYKVQAAPAPGAAAAPPAAPPPTATAPAPAVRTVENRWYAVVQMPATGHYIVQVSVNGQLFPQVKGVQQKVIELTSKVNPGRNEVLVTLLPVPGAAGAAGLPAVEVIVGKGREGADGALEITSVAGRVNEKTGVRTATAHPIPITAIGR